MFVKICVNKCIYCVVDHSVKLRYLIIYNKIIINYLYQFFKFPLLLSYRRIRQISPMLTS